MRRMHDDRVKVIDAFTLNKPGKGVLLFEKSFETPFDGSGNTNWYFPVYDLGEPSDYNNKIVEFRGSWILTDKEDGYLEGQLGGGTNYIGNTEVYRRYTTKNFMSAGGWGMDTNYRDELPVNIEVSTDGGDTWTYLTGLTSAIIGMIPPESPGDNYFGAEKLRFYVFLTSSAYTVINRITNIRVITGTSDKLEQNKLEVKAYVEIK